MAADKFLVYKNNPTTGSKSLVGDVFAASQVAAVKKAKEQGIIKKGRYLVISASLQQKNSVLVK